MQLAVPRELSVYVLNEAWAVAFRRWNWTRCWKSEVTQNRRRYNIKWHIYIIYLYIYYYIKEIKQIQTGFIFEIHL